MFEYAYRITIIVTEAKKALNSFSAPFRRRMRASALNGRIEACTSRPTTVLSVRLAFVNAILRSVFIGGVTASSHTKSLPPATPITQFTSIILSKSLAVPSIKIFPTMKTESPGFVPFHRMNSSLLDLDGSHRIALPHRTETVSRILC